MNGTGYYCVKWNKTDFELQISHLCFILLNLKLHCENRGLNPNGR